tara:strand:- start:3119 stop:3799 length:681 start_codon:yes stop_codon:yes gene_type:complete
MLKSPVIPTIFSIVLLVFGCSSIEIKNKETEETNTKKSYSTGCEQASQPIMRRKHYIFCAKKSGDRYFHQLSLLKRVKKNKYEKIRIWPKEQYFSFHKNQFREYILVPLESHKSKLLPLNEYEWVCNKQECKAQKTACILPEIKQPLFPNLNQKVQKLAGYKFRSSYPDILPQLTANALSGNYRSYKIIQEYSQWFRPSNISFAYAQYLRNELMEKKLRCNQWQGS